MVFGARSEAARYPAVLQNLIERVPGSIAAECEVLRKRATPGRCVGLPSDTCSSTPPAIGLCQDFTHLFNQLHWLVWFLNESGQALALKLADRILLVVSAREDDSDLRPSGSDRPKNLFARYVLHGHIQQHSSNLVRVSSEHLYSGAPICGHHHGKSSFLQRFTGDEAYALFIIDNQDGSRTAPHLDTFRALLDGRCRLFRAGKENFERGTLAWLAVQLDGPAVTSYDAQHGRQPQPASCELCRKERIEDPAPGFLVHSAAGIANLQIHVTTFGQMLI